MIETLKKKLNYCGRVTTTRNNLGWKIFDYIINHKDCLLEFNQTKFSFINYDVFQQDNWVTYDKCRHLTFYLQDDKLIAEVNHFTKSTMLDSYDNIEHVWFAKFDLPLSFLTEIDDLISMKFDDFCSESYYEYLESKRIEWIKEFKEKILA